MGVPAIINQKGYTLILVMIIISVIIILGISLSGTILNARKQFNLTESKNKATDLAEMGITYYLSVNNSLIKPAQDAAENNILTNFCTEFKKQLSSNEYYLPKTVDGDNRYQITFDSSRTTSNLACLTNPDTLDIGFYSTGYAGSSTPVKLKGSFKIEKNTRAGEPAPLLSLFLSGILDTAYSTTSLVNYGSVTVNQNQDYTINNVALFNQLTLHGNGNEQHYFTINNDAYFLNQISLNGHTKLTINGDAIFFNIDPIDKLTQKADLCITGNTYSVSGGKLVDLDISAFNQCAGSKPQTDWQINPSSGITVTYP